LVGIDLIQFSINHIIFFLIGLEAAVWFP